MQVTNAFNVDEWYSELYEIGKEAGGDKFKGINLLPLVDPMYLCVGWLDEDHKQLIQSKLDILLKRYANNTDIEKKLKVLKTELNQKLDVEYEKARYVRHTKALDKIRNTNVLDFVPQLQRYW
jgi:hypothetical protein